MQPAWRLCACKDYYCCSYLCTKILIPLISFIVVHVFTVSLDNGIMLCVVYSQRQPMAAAALRRREDNGSRAA